MTALAIHTKEVTKGLSKGQNIIDAEKQTTKIACVAVKAHDLGNTGSDTHSIVEGDLETLGQLHALSLA